MSHFLFTYAGLPVATLLHCSVLWRISTKSPNKDHIKQDFNESKQLRPGRTALTHVRTVRLGLFMASFVYLTVVTFSTTLSRSGPAKSKQALGLLACCLLVAAKFWITALTFVPHFEQANLNYNVSITACMWILQNLGAYSAVVTGLSGVGSFFCSTLSWALLSILMDAPLDMYLPVQLVELMLYTILHLEFHKLSFPHCISILSQYSVLGMGLPTLFTQSTNRNSMVAIQVPYGLFLSASVVLSTCNMLHLVLSITSVAHIVQDTMTTSWMSTMLSCIMQNPLGSSHYGYGLSSSITVPLLLGLLMVVGLVRGVLAFEASQAWPEWKEWCLKHPNLSVLLQLVLALPPWKKLLLAGLAGITVLQALAMKGMVVVLVLESGGLLDLGGDSTFLFLPSILVALLLQFMAVGALLLPSNQPPPSPAAGPKATPVMPPALSTAGSIPCSISAGADSVPTQPVAVAAVSGTSSSKEKQEELSFSQESAMGSDGVAQHLNPTSSVDADRTGLIPVLHDMALAAAQPTVGQVVLPASMDKPTVVTHLQDFTRGLREHEPPQGARQFVGMANASLQALFPGVKYASMSVLSLDCAQEVYITVVLGAGMNQPKMAVKVVPCTLLVYVLDSGQAVFISNTDTFAGPFSDVQFMRMAVGLRAVACLPLLWREGETMQVYGVMLMGFPEPRTWSDEDKKYAKQLAMVLAEGIPLLDAEEPVLPYSPNGSMNKSGGIHVMNSSSEPHSPSATSYASDASHYQRSPCQHESKSTLAHTSLALSKAGSVQANGTSPTLDVELKLLEIIGRGGFGSVYKGIWQGQEVAVKVLEHGEDFMGCADDPLNNSHASGGGDDAAAALSEGRMTLNIRHPNVVQTYDLKVVDLTRSVSDNGNGPLRGSLQQTRIIMEFCDRGCLQDAVDRGLLHTGLPSEGGQPDMEAIVLTLSEVSSALAHLHSHNITHRDLKPKNILLKTANIDRRGFTTKVSDFGLSQVLKENEGTFISSKYGGTITHMPPELLEEGRVYPMGDVYAFGIIMWEVYAGATPYANMVRPQIMVGVVTHNLRPKFPESCPEWYRSLAYRCWRKDPKQRPSFSHVTAHLQNILCERLWEKTEA